MMFEVSGLLRMAGCFSEAIAVQMNKHETYPKFPSIFKGLLKKVPEPNWV
jgi:hypothetical protein